MKLSLKAFRVNAGLSIEEAADIAEVSVQIMERWESDTEELKMAEVESIMKLCDAYGIKAEDIKL